MAQLDPRREKLKAETLRRRGYFAHFHEAILLHDPDWLERYLAFTSEPTDAGRIPAHIVHLIYVAIDAAPSHLYPRGIEIHFNFARKCGATTEEMVETLQIATSLAALTGEAAFPVLAEELERAGIEVGRPDPSKLNRLRDAYRERMGQPLPDWIEQAIGLAPGYVVALMDLIELPWVSGKLSPKHRAFIALACYASPAVLDRNGIRTHIREALRHGATPEELADVIALASGIGIHALSVGLPILMKQLDEDGVPPSAEQP